MSILRKHQRRGYTHVDNDLCEADGLSFRARGIALVLLSKPDDWEIKIEYLMKKGKEGKKAIRTALQELAEFGFLMRDRERSADGHVRTITRIADYPAFIDVGTVASRILGYAPKSTDLPVSDMSVTGSSRNREVGKGEVLLNTDKSITRSTNNRHKKRDYNHIPDEPRRKYSQD